MADDVSKKRIAELEKELAALKAQEKVSATQDGVAAGQVAVGGNVQGNVIIAKEGARIVIGEEPILMTAVERESALGRYLTHVISRNRYLQLQGIRSGGKLVNIELDRIYITLHTTRVAATVQLSPQQEPQQNPSGLRDPKGLEREASKGLESTDVKIEEALRDNLRMVVLGDPGSGKTTLMRYLALCYARDRAEGKTFVRRTLQLNESGHLPILLPLRNLGAYLAEHHRKDDGTEGHARLLDFLRAYLKNQRINLPDNFFDSDLEAGKVVLLLDGMDEVGDSELRRRVARLIDSFAAAYPKCRLIVTSRIVGYSGAARLGEDFAVTTVRDFVLADVEKFLSHWHLLVAAGQMLDGENAEQVAAAQTAQLMNAIKTNPRVRELAINPLMLTVIALVHRDRVKLPDRRAELYAEAVDVLLGKWDEARGVEETRIFDDRSFEAGDKRLILQGIALQMHESNKKEIEAAELRSHLKIAFAKIVTDARSIEKAVDRFLNVIQERSGLLVEAGQGVYRFSHLTFQEYLAALAILARDDYVNYVLKRAPKTEWREVILLVVGELSKASAERTTKLIQRLADLKNDPTPYHHLVLAVEALRDAGTTRVEAKVAMEIQNRLKSKIESERPAWSKMFGKLTVKSWVEERGKVLEALARSGSGYWTMPHGEPEWINIPAGEFWMGSDQGESDEKPEHRVFVPEFKIARVPITNAQYLLYVQATGAKPPEHWQDGQIPRGKTSHPVVRVSWDEAQKYCEWLHATRNLQGLQDLEGLKVRLPTEAEWEKAARGDKDKRAYPWGDGFDSAKCNTSELGLGDTSPVGVFPNGASPYGCLDMSGNVWEWCQSKYKPYPYKADDGREVIDESRDERVVRGGSWFDYQWNCRAASRIRSTPLLFNNNVGFRLALSPIKFLDS